MKVKVGKAEIIEEEMDEEKIAMLDEDDHISIGEDMELLWYNTYVFFNIFLSIKR